MEHNGNNIEWIKKWTGGVLFVFCLFITALIGFIVLGILYLPLFMLAVPFAQWVYDTLMSFWFAFAVALYELVYGVKIVIQGDVRKMNKTRSVLYIMNHRTRLDWMFFFSIQMRYGSLRNFKIALKNELRHIPGAGWAMQAAQFLFLKRKWDKDKENIETNLKLFEKNGTSPQLLFFPEGTDLQAISRQTSRNYAEKNELEDYEYVLHPRTLGFTSIVSFMRTYNRLEQVVDVTVSYPKNILQRETDLITGNIPRQVVFTIQTYEMSEIPADNEPLLIRWVEDRWKEKEIFLRSFYENKKYGESNGYSVEQNVEIERDSKLYMVAAIVFWSVLSLLSFYLYFSSWYFRWMFLLSTVLCIFGSTFIGIDILLNRVAIL